MDQRPHLFDLTPSDLRQHLASLGLRPFRGDQLVAWVYRHRVADPTVMTDLPVADRPVVAKNLRFNLGRVAVHQQASDGLQKLLIDWDGNSDGTAGGTESVLIPDAGSKRLTACLSSQVGCPVGCRFCASGLSGLKANLSAGQIVEQAWHLSRVAGGQRISHVVFMGMGEPLANLTEVVRAVELLTADWGMGLARRRITISTVGLPAQIRRLAGEGLGVRLAISLHAPSDALRRKLIPWARQVTIAQLVEAARDYFEKTQRRITWEYVLLRGVNDRAEQARELAAIAGQLPSQVNLIRYNEVKGLPFARPATADVLRFQTILRKASINVQIRASRGRAIAAACGQLRLDQTPNGASSTGARGDVGLVGGALSIDGHPHRQEG